MTGDHWTIRSTKNLLKRAGRKDGRDSMKKAKFIEKYFREGLSGHEFWVSFSMRYDTSYLKKLSEKAFKAQMRRDIREMKRHGAEHLDIILEELR